MGVRKTHALLFSGYVAVLFKLIVLKGNFETLYHHFFHKYSAVIVMQQARTANFIPFATIYYYLSGQDTTGTIPNIIGNIILFIPFGFLFPNMFSPSAKFSLCLQAAIFASLCFEAIQIVLAYGTFDIDDCILNGVGAVIGYCLLRFVLGVMPSVRQ